MANRSSRCRTAAISGILTSKPDSRDVEISHFSVSIYGSELIQALNLSTLT